MTKFGRALRFWQPTFRIRLRRKRLKAIFHPFFWIWERCGNAHSGYWHLGPFSVYWMPPEWGPYFGV